MFKKFDSAEKFFSIILFLSYLFIWLLGSGAVHAGDSDGYKNPIIDHDFHQMTRSVIGDWYRTPSIVIPFEIVGGYTNITILQFVIAFVANTVLAITLLRFFSSKKIAVSAAIIASSILLSNNIVTWNWIILSEGLGISYTVFAISMFLMAFKHPSKLNVSFFVLFAFLGGLTRLPLLFLFGIMALVLIIKYFKEIRTRKLIAQVVLALAAFSALALICTMWWSASFVFWQQGTPREMYTAVHTTSSLSPIGSAVKEAAISEIPPPKCFRFSADSSDVNPAISEDSLCAEAKTWAVLYSSWYPKYLVKHPAELMRITAWAIPRSVGNASLSAGTSPIPAPISEILLGSNISTWEGGGRPVGQTDPRVYFDFFIFLVLVAALSIFASVKKTKISNETKAFALLAISALAVALVGTITLPTTNLEIGRIGVEPNIAFRLFLLIWFLQIIQSYGRNAFEFLFPKKQRIESKI